MQADKKRVAAIERVCKLAMMTVEKGCTEAEELEATARGQVIIERYDLTLSELTEAAGIQEAKMEPGDTPFAYGFKIRYTSRASEMFGHESGTKTVVDSPWGPVVLQFD